MAENLGHAVLEIDIDDAKLEKGLKQGKAQAQAFVSEVKQIFSQIKLELPTTPLQQAVKGADSALKGLTQTVKEDGTVLNRLQFETASAAQALQKLTQNKIQLAQEAAQLKNRLLEEAAAQRESSTAARDSRADQQAQWKRELGQATAELKSRLTEEAAAQKAVIADMKADEYQKTAQLKRSLAEQTSQLKMRLMEEKAAADHSKSGLEAIKSVASAAGSSLQSLVSHAGSAVAKLTELGGAAAGAAASGLGKVASATGGAVAGLAKLSAAGGAALVALTGVGVKSAAELEESVNNIASIKPDIDTSAVFKSLNDLSTKVPQSAAQLGDSLYNVFSSIDVSSEGALKLVENFSKGAVGAQTDAATFGTAIMGQMNAYKLSVGDASHLSDVFFNTVKNGVVTGQELASSLGPVTGAAKAAGVNIDELGAMIAGVTKEGGPAAQNINNLSNMFMKITTKEAVASMKQLGVAAVDNNGKFRSTIDIMGDLKTKLAGMTEAQRANALQAIFPDAQARQGAQTIMSQLDNVKSFLDENINKSGAAEAAYQKMVSGFSAQTKILVNTFKATLTTVGGELLPVLTPVVQGLTKGLQQAQPQIQRFAKTTADALGSFFDGLSGVFNAIFGPGTGDKIAATIRQIAASFGPMIDGFIKIASAASPLGFIFAALRGFQSGGITGALDAVGTRFGQLGTIIQTSAPQVLAGLTQLGTQVLTWLQSNLPQILSGAAGFAKQMVEMFAPDVGALLAQLGQVGLTIINWIIANGPMILSTLGGWAKSFIEWIAPAIPVVLQKLGELAGMIFGWILEQAPGFIAQLGTWGQEFINWIGPQIPPLLAELGKLAQQAWDWIVAQAPVLAAQIGAWGNELWNWVVTNGPTLLKELSKVGQQVLDWILEQAPIIGNQIMQWADEFQQWVGKEVVPKLPGVLADIWSTMNDFIGETASKIGSALLKWVTEMAEKWIQDTVGKIPGELGKIWDSLSGWIGDTAKNIGAKAADIGRNIVDGVVSGINAMAGKVKAAIQSVVTDPLGAVGNLLGIHSPSTVTRDKIGKPIAEGVAVGITESGRAALKAMLDVANSIGNAGSDAALKHAKNMADTAKGVADAITNTTKAFSALNGLKGGLNVDALNVTMDGLNNITATFMASAGKFKEKGLAAAQTYAESAGKIVSSIKTGVDALNALNKYKGVATTQIDLFTADLQVLVGDMIGTGEQFKAEAVQAGATYAEGAGKMVALVANGVKGFEALREYKAVAEKPIDDFVTNLSALVEFMITGSSHFEEEGLKAATQFADSAGKMIAVISNGVKAFQELSDYKAIYEDGIDDFVTNLETLAEFMVTVSTRFEDEGLKAASTFGESTGKMVALIKPGVDGFLALQNFKGVPAKAIDVFIGDLIYVAQKMLEGSQKFDQEALPGVNKFSDSVSKIVSALKGALDFFKSLDGFKGVMPLTIDWLAFDIKYAVEQMALLAQKIDGEGLTQALAFSDSTSKLFNALKPALDFFKQLADQKSVPVVGTDALITGVAESVKKLSEANVQALAFQQLAQQFASNITQGLTLIAQATGSALGALQPLTGAADNLPVPAGAALPQLSTANLPALPAPDTGRALNLANGTGGNGNVSVVFENGAVKIDAAGQGGGDLEKTIIQVFEKKISPELVRKLKSNRNNGGSN